MKNRQAGLLFIFITVLLDVIGFGIIIPIMPQLVADLSGGDISSSSSLYGILISTYALMQFLFAPMLGALSDQYGRRPVILLSLLGSAISLLIMAVAPNYAILYIGRVIAGITGASLIPANAYIADVSPPEKRAQNFGLVGAGFGLGFIIGPAIGGALGSFGPRVPFYFAAGLTLLNMLYGMFVLPESHKPENRRPFTWAKANPITSVTRLAAYPVVFGLTWVVVFLSLAQQALQSTWVLYTTYRFNWDSLQNGLSLAMVGIVAAVVQGGLLRTILPRLGERRALLMGLGLSVLSNTLYGLANQSWMMYAIIVIGGFAFIATPAAQGLISRQVGPDQQGMIQGTLTSIISLTGIIAPLFATFLFGHFTGPQAWANIPGIAFFAGAALSLVALVLAVRSFTQTRKIEQPAPATGR